MNGLMEFANNLADVMIWLMIPISLICGFIGFTSWEERDRKKYPYGSTEYANSTWRMWASAQIVGIAWMIYLIVAAVPTPDYMIKEVVQEKKVEVTALTKFQDAYDDCIQRYGNYLVIGRREIVGCEQVALAISNPNVKQLKYEVRVPGPVREKRVREIVTRTRTLAPSYERIYNACIEDFKYGGSALLHSEAKLCHNQAVWGYNSESGKGGVRYWIDVDR